MTTKKTCTLLFLTFILLINHISGYAESTPDLQDVFLFNYEKMFLQNLEIIKGAEISAEPDASVSREMFTAMTVRAINTYVDTSPDACFADILPDNQYYKEINTAHSLGIVNGISPMKFGTGNISKIQALKIVITALGYEPLVSVSGGYPTGYLKVAGELDLKISGLNNDEDMTFYDAVSLISNMLTAPVFSSERIVNGNTIYSGSETVLEFYHHLKKYEGVIESVGLSSSLSQYSVTDYKYIYIDGLRLKLNTNLYDGYLGYSADAYYDEADNLKTMMIHTDNRSETVAVDTITEFSSSELISYSETKDKDITFKLSPSMTYVKNGRLSLPPENFSESGGGTVTVIDNDGDNRYDYVISKIYDYAIIKSVDSYNGIITDMNGHIYNGVQGINLMSDNECRYIIDIYPDAPMADISQLKSEMTALVYMSDDNRLIHIEAAEKILDGTVTGVGEDFIEIEGTKYCTNPYFDKYYTVRPGEKTGFYIAPDGTVSGFKRPLSTNMLYGYFMNVSAPVSSMSPAKIQLYTSSGKSETFEVSDKLIVDGERADDVKSALNQRFVVYSETGDAYPDYQLIKYSLDADRKINYIDTLSDSKFGESADTDDFKLPHQYPDPKNTLTRYFKEKTVWWSANTKNIMPYGTVADAVVFHVPASLLTNRFQKLDEYAFSVGSIDWSNDTRDKTVSGYDYSDRYTLGAVEVFDVEYSSGSGASPISVGESPSYIVENVTDAVTDEEIVSKKLLLYDGSKFITAFMNPDILSKISVPKSGDVVRIAYDAKGYVAGLAIDIAYDPVRKTGVCSSTNSIYATVGYNSGKVFSFSDNNYCLMFDKPMSMEGYTDDSFGGLSFYTPVSALNVLCYNTETGNARPASVSEIKTVTDTGYENASSVIVRFRYSDMNTIVIYE